MPELSVVVRVANGGELLGRCLASVLAQVGARDIEVIAAYDSAVPGIEALRAAYPAVRFIDCGAPQETGIARINRRNGAALAAATAAVVAQIEDAATAADDWCEQVLAAHRLPHGAIGGAVAHGGRGALNWALYLLDYGRYQPPFTEGPGAYLTDINVSYKRAALTLVEDSWRDGYDEAATNWALTRAGVTLWRRPQIVVHLDRGALALGASLRERYSWGRAFGSERRRALAPVRALLQAAATPLVPPVLVARALATAARGGRVGHGLACLPHLALLASAWSLGELAGTLGLARE